MSMSFFIFCYNFFMYDIKLKELRIERGLTQKELALVLDCSQSMITRWEKGECEPTENIIRKTAIFFDVSTDYLLGLEDDVGAKTYIRNSFNNFNNNGTIKIK